MAETLLVTGLGGFVGQHIQTQVPPHWRLLPPMALDVLDTASIDGCLAQCVPDAVIHLAGQTFVPESFRNPEKTLQVNLMGTLNLLQALKRHKFNGSFLYVSSGDVYGQVNEDSLPITESLQPRPSNPYAVSKVAAELLCQQWSRVEPWRIMVARPFNHIGPGQRPDFVIADMARQLVRVNNGLQDPRLIVGDVDVSRDFLDVHDVISAYFSLLANGRDGEIYNVCSGQEQSVRGLIEKMAGLLGVKIELVQDPQRFRPSDQRRVIGCSEKLRQETGWAPAVTIDHTLQCVLTDWRARV
ncbi:MULTISPECIES: GDP-mannose 4,6-dehydratase [unclassified Pseudomonas]|uniref:GDP-mannose 4,6-dehydratase n=1 Tax=unclassified Pseudomonas TaxID=196821 RepID=UPI00244CA5D6|nr:MULTISPECIES: GDP-mannose 4,6-dehydratase [unclassified Pseudomonas]MDG9925182.1 GDP-mannose 4,6-dehydratase [Pseudomonas sp. GD04045]MDH0035312.1 GDP-mannose 4,6-dehydratase [Pseudomonas sp. GD04019]